MTATPPLNIWVIDREVTEATFERLGDARVAADRLGYGVGVFVASPGIGADALAWRGADHVVNTTAVLGPDSATRAALRVLQPHSPRLILVGGDVQGREWAARLAAAADWKLASPALSVQVRAGVIDVTVLDRAGRLTRSVRGDAGETLIVTMRPGVAEALTADPSRTCTTEIVDAPPASEAVRSEQIIPADPAHVDIRFATRLVAGGRGLGGKEGFDKLRAFADKLHAGVAASRMAVDLGWIEHERQVGQTGRTVKPDLYIACGISGASHHLEGIADVRHIVAINTDPQAPIFKAAHLGLVADLYEVLRLAEVGINPSPIERSSRPGEGGEIASAISPGEGIDDWLRGARAGDPGSSQAPSPPPSPGRGSAAARGGQP